MPLNILAHGNLGRGSTIIRGARSAATVGTLALLGMASAHAAGLQVTPSSVSVAVGSTSAVHVSQDRGTVTVRSASTQVATATYANHTVTIRGVRVGGTTVHVADRQSSRDIAVTVFGSTPTLAVSPTSLSVVVGATGQIRVSGATGAVTVRSANPLIASVTLTNGIASVLGLQIGSTSISVADSRASRSVPVTVRATTGGGGGASGGYALLAWNDLGMHCVDGADFSVFSLLPPYNNLHAQLVNVNNPSLVTANVTLTYESVADAAGSINTISSTKTNFWQFVQPMFGLQPAANIGLTGNPTPSRTPAPLTYNATQGWYEASAIPITPVDDAMQKNFYPLVKVVARDGSGAVIASTINTLPVSDEMTCIGCHKSVTTGTAAQLAARPTAGWVFDAAPERDWKRNVLRLHDQKHLGTAAYMAAIATQKYDVRGLLATADGGRPILCAGCHLSNALEGFGVAGVTPLTAALHTRHSTVIDPVLGIALNVDTTRTACYNCHPGSKTQCLRGAMSNVVDTNGNVAISCQSCHGTIAAVGKAGRVGWLQEPNCQSCHHDGLRETNSLDPGGNLRVVGDQRFATVANRPATGFSLFRFSAGHGGLQCEACHGSTHAEYPSLEPNDNVQSIALQGYAGTVTECKSCHASVPITSNGGPHGMHTIGAAWVGEHSRSAEGSGVQSCAYCHGADFRGSPLSEIKIAKSFRAKEGGNLTFAARHMMNCYDCHNGPGGGG